MPEETEETQTTRQRIARVRRWWKLGEKAGEVMHQERLITPQDSLLRPEVARERFDAALMDAELFLLEHRVTGLGTLDHLRRGRMVELFNELADFETSEARDLFREVEKAYVQLVPCIKQGRPGWED